MSDPLLEIEGLAVRFAGERAVVHALRGVSLTISRGEIAGVVGESGSGKSTLGMAILRLLPPRAQVVAGKTRFDGQDLFALGPDAMRALRGRRISFVPQEPMTALNPTVRVGRQLELVLRQHLGVTGKQAHKRAADQLSRMHVADPDRVLNAYPFELSGGLRQRVLLTNAFLCKPDLIIADEPTTALDVTVQAEVLDILRECAREDGAAVCLITHNMGVVWRLCDSIHVMRAGEVVEHGSAREVLSDPQSDYARALLAALPERAQRRRPIRTSADGPHNV